jgi:hypothetical protein
MTGHLIWGECAGSGANPYRVMADLRDLGNKCTCPSRKFPCKHVLALLWLKAEAVVPFGAADTPEWVSDWLGRRRTGGTAAKPATRRAHRSRPRTSRAALVRSSRKHPRTPRRSPGARQPSAKRAEDTERAILEALDALEQWIGDQLRLGLGAFVDDATARCRRIGARLVDGKAAMLAGRVDELPARLLALPSGDRARGAVVELGKLVLLARAFRAAPRDADIRRAVASAESREAVLGDAQAVRLTAIWEVLAEQVQTRRDGLVSQTTWLLNLGAAGPRFAMLLDFFPASAGKRGSVFTPGDQFRGELVFYPGRTAAARLAAQPLAGRRAGNPAGQRTEAPLAETLSAPLLAEPWTIDVPVLLPGGRIAVDDALAGRGGARPRATRCCRYRVRRKG